MSILRSAEECGPGLTQGYKQKECKPDYEEMIKKCKINLEKVKNLIDSTLEYMQLNHPTSTLSTMLGELVFERYRYGLMIEEYIKEQEKD